MIKIRAPMCSLELAVNTARTSKHLEPERFELQLKAFADWKFDVDPKVNADHQVTGVRIRSAAGNRLAGASLLPTLRPFAVAYVPLEQHPHTVATPLHACDPLLFTIKSRGKTGHIWRVRNQENRSEELWTVEAKSRDIPSLGQQHYWHTTERHEYVDSPGKPTKGPAIAPLLDIVPTVYTPEAPAPPTALSH
jgi:hypothetical protein